jgi:hypothetical protein
MVFINCGLTPLNESYGFTSLLIDHDDGMYESIDIHTCAPLIEKNMWVKEWE